MAVVVKTQVQVDHQVDQERHQQMQDLIAAHQVMVLMEEDQEVCKAIWEAVRDQQVDHQVKVEGHLEVGVAV